uniref:Cation_ATPase_C domain-containing protein n=1 Tax=Macrostomum lignano TaxID=282301 RepID=A0A1I8FJR8_9PLAT
MLSGYISASDHVVQANIYFLSSRVTLFEEDWQYPLRASCLWVGASVLTMLEFVELLVGLIAIGFNIRSAKCHAAGRADSRELVEATAAVDKAA